MLTIVVVIIGQIYQIILREENHPRGVDITFAGYNADTALQPPAMWYLIDRKELVEVLFGDFGGVGVGHVAEELLDGQFQFA